MRSSAFVYVSVLMTIIMIGIISLITMRSSYAELIDANVDDAVVYSVRMLQTDRNIVDSAHGGYQQLLNELEVTSNSPSETLSDFKKSFIYYLSNVIDEDVVNMDVSFYGADSVRGILSVEVSADYVYPFGITGTVSTYKTVILDKLLAEDKNEE